MLKPSLVLPILSLLSIACSTTPEIDTGKNVKLKVDKIESAAKLSEFIDSINYIKLETTDKSFISEVSHVKMLKDNVVIFDDPQNAILCFDIKGNFKYKIKQVGKGPKEYIKISGFDIFNGVLAIHDRMTKKALFFNLKTGKFKNEIKIKYDFSSILMMEDGFLAYTNNNPNLVKGKIPQNAEVYYFDYNGKIIDVLSRFPIYLNYVHDYNNYVFCRNMNDVYFSPILTGRIYKFDKVKMHLDPILNLQLDNNNFFFNILKELNSNSLPNGEFNARKTAIEARDNSNEFYHSGPCCFINNKVFFMTVKQRKSHINIYNIDKNTLMTFRKITNDIDNVFPFLFMMPLKGVYDNAFIYSITYDDIATFKNEGEHQLQYKKNIKASMENPTIAILNFKKHEEL
ncbi:6-bladed beta-propeller [Saccharicrinis sp. FJH2]|uniref:6-bladed beta-propeller n=1 Tax=Saccharicrinis sp. FJH65 TaxID=3344659 RepID=UPI0035F3CB82